MSFDAALLVHIASGTICLLTGPVALLARKTNGLHTVTGEVYHASYVLILITSVIMAILHWEQSAFLLYIAIFSYGLALFGYVARKRQRPGWLGRHISGMGGSYIGVITAVLVVNGPNLPGLSALLPLLLWFLPTIVGSPLIGRTIARRM